MKKTSINPDKLSIVKGCLPGSQSTPQKIGKDDIDKIIEETQVYIGMQLDPLEFLLNIKGRPCFPRGSIVTVDGKAKSGKTYYTSILMAACTADEVMGFSRTKKETPLKCFWYDTEQNKESTLEILQQRIAVLAGDNFAPEMYAVQNVSERDWEERLPILEASIARHCPDLVIVDGVCDLIYDINDGPGNKLFVEQIMHMAKEHKCCIVCVIHQNKGAEDRSPRGSIGTAMLNKSFDVYACELIKPEMIFCVEQTHSRKYWMDDRLYYVVDDNGLPRPSVGPAAYVSMTSHPDQKSYPPMNEKYLYWEDERMKVDLRSLFYDILKSGPLYYSDLQKNAMELLNCKDTGFWNKLFNQAKNDGIIVNTRNNQNKSVWALPPKAVPAEPDVFELAARGAGDDQSF